VLAKKVVLKNLLTAVIVAALNFELLKNHLDVAPHGNDLWLVDKTCRALVNFVDALSDALFAKTCVASCASNRIF
jgi:hypothetical protein